MQKTFFFLIIISFSVHSFAQDTRSNQREAKKQRINNAMRQEEEGVITNKKSFAVGAKLITDGYGIFFELGRASTVKKSILYQLEISERKSNKEFKQTSFFSNASPYIYGKENFFYPVKLGVQQQILLGNKSNKNGVAITGNYGGGIAAAFLRPYYVQVDNGNSIDYVKYNSSDSLQFLTGKIIGGPGISKGWNEITVTPGLYAKAALRFDYGRFNEIVSAIEVGVTGDFYSKKIPLMVYNPEKQFFFSGYVAIMFGKRK